MDRIDYFTEIFDHNIKQLNSKTPGLPRYDSDETCSDSSKASQGSFGNPLSVSFSLEESDWPCFNNSKIWSLPQAVATHNEAKFFVPLGALESEVDFCLSLRGLISDLEAGMLTGSRGEKLEALERESGSYIVISNPSAHNNDRVINVYGTLHQVAKAYSLIARRLVESPLTWFISTNNGNDCRILTHKRTFIRLLLAHSLVGSIIGSSGSQASRIETRSRVKVVALKGLLPHSTDRVVEIQGSVSNIEVAVFEVGLCYEANIERTNGNIFYQPSVLKGPGYFNHAINNRDDNCPYPGKPFVV